jgi:hypothetical protein
MSQEYCRAAPYQDSLTRQVKRNTIPPGGGTKARGLPGLRRLGWRHSPNGIGRRDPAVVALWSRRTREPRDLSPWSVAWYDHQAAHASPERKESSSYSLGSPAGLALLSRQLREGEPAEHAPSGSRHVTAAGLAHRRSESTLPHRYSSMVNNSSEHAARKHRPACDVASRD